MSAQSRARDCVLCRPAREVGGNYSDFLKLPGGKLGVAIGDVSGKGIGAALLMSNLDASLCGQAPIAEHLPHLICHGKQFGL